MTSTGMSNCVPCDGFLLLFSSKQCYQLRPSARPITFTVAHICKHNKQFLKHNKHFSKHNIVLSEHNKLLSKHNTVLSKHITILSKHNTVSSKHNTIYRNTTQSLQNTTQISQNTTQYLRNTTQSFPDYVMQDVTIQGINPGRTSYMIPIVYRYIYSYLLTYSFCLA